MCIGWSVLIYHLLVEDVYCCGARKSGKVVLVGVVAGVQKIKLFCSLLPKSIPNRIALASE
jgi:hypothetical protein